MWRRVGCTLLRACGYFWHRTETNQNEPKRIIHLLLHMARNSAHAVRYRRSFQLAAKSMPVHDNLNLTAPPLRQCCLHLITPKLPQPETWRSPQRWLCGGDIALFITVHSTQVPGNYAQETGPGDAAKTAHCGQSTHVSL